MIIARNGADLGPALIKIEMTKGEGLEPHWSSLRTYAVGRKTRLK